MKFVDLIRRLRSVCCVAVLCGSVYGGVAAESLRLCAKCGWEQAVDASACTHCGAPLVVRDTPQPAPVPVLTNALPEVVILDPDLVRREVAEAAAAAAKGDHLLAALLFRNAAALNRLTDSSTAEARAAEISRLMRRELEAAELPSHVKREAFVVGRAKSRFKELQEGRLYTAVGEGAWVPEGIYPKLNTRQKSTLIRMTAKPCASCIGLGRVACKACEGSRLVKCPNSKCKDGYIEEKVGGRLASKALIAKDKCPDCKGKGKVLCAACQGRGDAVCTACNGDGQRPMCTRCFGEGVLKCPQCRGAVSPGSCPTCGGEGIVFCAGCAGEGRK